LSSRLPASTINNFHSGWGFGVLGSNGHCFCPWFSYVLLKILAGARREAVAEHALKGQVLALDEGHVPPAPLERPALRFGVLRAARTPCRE